jgi:hypothetical protein
VNVLSLRFLLEWSYITTKVCRAVITATTISAIAPGSNPDEASVEADIVAGSSALLIVVFVRDIVSYVSCVMGCLE